MTKPGEALTPEELDELEADRLPIKRVNILRLIATLRAERAINEDLVDIHAKLCSHSYAEGRAAALGEVEKAVEEAFCDHGYETDSNHVIDYIRALKDPK